MEIRARITLAIQQFKANAGAVSGVFRSMTTDAQKYSQNVDKLIQKNLVNRLDASQRGKVADMRNLTDFEKMTIASHRRMQKAAMEAQYRNKGGAKPTTAGMPLPLRDKSAENNIKHRRTLESQYNAWWQGQLQRNLALRFRYEAQGVKAASQSVAQIIKLTALEAAEAAKAAAYKAKYNAVYYIGKGKMAAQSMANTIRESSLEIREGAKLASGLMSLKAREVSHAIKQHQVKLNWQRAEDQKYFDWLEKRSRNNLNNRTPQTGNKFQAKLEFVGSKEFEEMAPRIRYALYDIANRAAAASAALAAMGIAAIKTFMQFESAFTSVERTAQLGRDATGGFNQEALKLRKTLIEISTTIPVAFEDVSKIATLGAQMGIASESLDQFTTTVAKFSAITGISVEQTAQSFGRLAQLMDVPVTKFENLSSAITYAGINAVATDQEILNMSESIAAAATQAGMSADQVIGLSTALASLKVRPEEARGVIVRLFREIDLSVTKGGKQIEDFSRVLGITSEEAAALWEQNPNQFFTSFLGAANAAGNLNEVITALGITNSRELNVIQRLAGNTGLLTSSLEDAREEYLLGQYSTEAYGKVADDLQSKLTVLNNTFQAFLASLAAPMGEFLKGPVDALTEFLNGIKNVPGPVGIAVAVIGGIATVMLAATAGAGLLMAGMLALRTVLVDVTVQGTKMTIGAGLMGAMFTDLAARTGILAFTQGIALKTTVALERGFIAMGFSAAGAATAVRALSFALPIIGVVALVAGTAMAFASANAQTAGDKFEELGAKALDANGGINVLAEALKKDTEAFNKATEAADGTAIKYGEIKLKLSELAIEQSNHRKTQIASKEMQEDLSDALLEGKTATDTNAKALGSAADQQERFNAVTKEGNDLKKEQTYVLGGNSAALFVQGFSKYIDDEGNIKDLFLDFVEDPTILEDATAFGFDLQEAINAGLSAPGTGGTDYLAGIQGNLEKFKSAFQDARENSPFSKDTPALIRAAGQEAGLLAGEIEGLVSRYGQLAPEQVYAVSGFNNQTGALAQLSPEILQAVESNDAYWKSAIQAMQADEARLDLINNMIIKYGDEEQQIEALSAQLEKYLGLTTQVEAANNDSYDSFEAFAKGTKEAGKSLTGVTKGARTNMKNWESYVTSALKAAEADGTGLVGFIENASSAMTVMAENGIDTSEQFTDVKNVTVEALQGMGGEYSQLAKDLADAPDMDSFRSIFSEAMVMAQGKGLETADMLADLYGAMNNPEAIENFRTVWGEAMTETGDDTAGAGAEVDKLQEALDRAFKSIQRFLSVNSAINSLGESLAKNGSGFDKFSKGGQDNINALIDTIQTLKDAADGDAKKLANDIVSLRQALINTGNAGPKALKLIKKALDEIGVSGKKSKEVVKQFAQQLRAMTGEAAQVVGLANAMSQLSGSVMEYLNARWMLGNAQLEIAAGWESIANGANDAREEIEDISDEIAGFAADRGILEYQLGIAIKYGDTLRANELRAQIAELNQREADLIADTAAAASEAQSNATPQADLLAQQQALQNMVGYYVQIGAAEVIGAKNKKDAKAAIAETVEKFKEQARAAGVSEENVAKYAKELRAGLKLARELNKPAEYKINARTQAALQEIRNFRDSANAAINAIRDTVTIKVTATAATGGLVVAGTGSVLKASTGGHITGPGSSTSDSIPVMLSNDEYVVRASAVRSYGLDFMNSLNNMTLKPGSMPNVSVGAAQSSGVVYLSPEDRALLRAAVDRPINLYSDSTKIAQSANQGNVLLAQRGLN